MSLHYQSEGMDSFYHKTPLVLLHGLFASGDNWRTIAKKLSINYPVIRVDLPNHGQSPHQIIQTYPSMAQEIRGLFKQLAIDRVHILGHSMGGKVAMQYAADFPEQVDKLIVVDIAPRYYPDLHMPLIDAMLSVDLEQLHSRAEVDKALSESIADIRIRQFLLMNLIQVEGQLKWRINLTALKSSYLHLQSAVYPSLPCKNSALFIHGKQSDYIKAADIQEIIQHFPEARFEELPTGHWVHAEQPDLFINTVDAFLK